MDNSITDWNYILSSFQHDSSILDFFFYYVTRERKEKNFISINSFVNDRFEIEIEKLSNILQIEKKKKRKLKIFPSSKDIENFPSELKKYTALLYTVFTMCRMEAISHLMHCFISGVDCIRLGENVTDIFSPRSFVVPFFTQLCTFDAESFNSSLISWYNYATEKRRKIVGIFSLVFSCIRERNFADTIFTTSFYGCLFDRIKKKHEMNVKWSSFHCRG